MGVPRSWSPSWPVRLLLLLAAAAGGPALGYQGSPQFYPNGLAGQPEPSAGQAGQLARQAEPAPAQQQPDAGQPDNFQQPPARAADGAIFRYQGQAVNSSAVKLVWSLLSGLHADHFDIQYGPIPETNVFTVSKLNGSARDYTLRELQPDTLYQFQLHGYHGDHVYKPQLVVVRTPPANQAPRADALNKEITPLGVKAEAKSNSSIQLSWTEPERPASIRNSHRLNVIRYYVNPSASAANQSADAQYHYLNVTNARESRLIVQRLKPATEYAFAVKTAYYTPDMRRLLSQSGFSMDTLARTFDLEPSAPRNFSVQALAASREEQLAGQSGRLELSWQPPESPNGQLRGYVILYSHEQQAHEDQWNRIEVNGANVNNWFVANLRPGWSYYFKMRALNQRGQSADSDTRLYVAPAPAPPDKIVNQPIPANNMLLMIVISLVAVIFLLFLVVSRLACRPRRKPRKGSLAGPTGQKPAAEALEAAACAAPKLAGSSSTVAARVGTLARRRENPASKPDYWISAMEQQQQPPDLKSNGSEKSGAELNMAMVSIRRDSPQFSTTQLAPALPEYRFSEQQLMQQLHQSQSQGHYHPGQFAYDQMDSATASALMTLSKRQQQQLQKYQIQFAATGNQPGAANQAPSPHQQPPPPPPLNIEQQSQHQHQHQPLYGSSLANTRSLRINRPTLYDPVSGSFVQSGDNSGQPPNYSSHHMQPMIGHHHQQQQQAPFGPNNSSTLQFHPHQTSTLLSRRSTNTLRSFQTSAGQTYGQLGAASHFTQALPPSSVAGVQQQPLLQSHQAVINQLNSSNYPSLPLKHVSAVRPQIVSNLEDQIVMELAEKEQQATPQQQQTIKQ